MTRAASGPTPGIEASSSTAARKGARCASTSRSTRAIAASSASTWSRCSRSRKRWCAVTRPRSASRSRSGVALSRGWASAASFAGSPSPATSASSIARPLLPSRSVTTPSSLTLASSSVFCSRSTWLARSRTSCLRVRRSERSSAVGPSGTKLARIRPCASSSASQVASFTSVLRPGHVLDLRRVGQDQHEPALGQDVPDRLPVDAGRLHGDVGAAVLRQPLGQLEQARGRGGEGADLAGDLAAGGEAHGGDHGRLVDVEAGAARIEDLHRSLLSARRRRGTPVGEV